MLKCCPLFQTNIGLKKKNEVYFSLLFIGFLNFDLFMFEIMKNILSLVSDRNFEVVSKRNFQHGLLEDFSVGD